MNISHSRIVVQCKDTSQYKYGSVKTCKIGKQLTSGCRPLLKNIACLNSFSCNISVHGKEVYQNTNTHVLKSLFLLITYADLCHPRLSAPK